MGHLVSNLKGYVSAVAIVTEAVPWKTNTDFTSDSAKDGLAQW